MQGVTLTITPRLAIAARRLAPATVGSLYRANVTTRGGVTPLRRWKKVVGQLPRGVRFNRAVGALIGTPRKTGRFSFAVEAVDALGVTAERTLVLVVRKRT